MRHNLKEIYLKKCICCRKEHDKQLNSIVNAVLLFLLSTLFIFQNKYI